MKTLKRGLMLLMAVFCLVGISACKKDNDSGEPDNKETMSKEEFYQKLLVLNAKLDNTKQYTIEGESKVGMSIISDKMTYRISVDEEHNKYANVEKNNDGEIIKSEYIVKSGDDYIKYLYEEAYFIGDEEKSSYYVGSDHVQHLMRNNDNLIDFNELDMSSYENFCKSFDEMLVKSSEDMKELELDSLETDVKMYEEDGTYNLEYSVSVSAAEEDEYAEMSATATMKFDDDFMVSIGMDTKITYTLDGERYTMKIQIINKYIEGFDDSMIPTDFSDYPQEIENIEFEVKYVVDGEEDRWGEEYTYLSGEKFVPDYDYEEIDNTYFDGWYLDEDCTISVDTLTDYPSYDLYLYGKTKPNENYALVIIEQTFALNEYSSIGPMVEKTAEVAGTIYEIPTTVNVYGNEGIVDSVTVNGESYTSNSITLQNGNVYKIVMHATSIENE